VYPFNRGIKAGVTTNFLGEGGDLAVGDELVFTNGNECSVIDDPSIIPAFNKVVFSRLTDGTFNYQQL
jgi:hypothetical protein